MKRVHVIGRFDGRTAEDVRAYIKNALDTTKDAVVSAETGVALQLMQLIDVLAREIEDLRG